MAGLSAFPGVKKSGELTVSSRPGPSFKASQRGLTTLGTEPTCLSGGCLESCGSLVRKYCLPRGPDTARPCGLGSAHTQPWEPKHSAQKAEGRAVGLSCQMSHCREGREQP